MSKTSNGGQVVPECRCPTCGHPFDRAEAFPRSRHPRPGDYSICINCRGLNVFAMDLTVRAPTDQELIAAAGDPKMRAITDAIAHVRAKLGPPPGKRPAVAPKPTEKHMKSWR